MVENRQKSDRDNQWDRHIPRSGLIITHVDKSFVGNWMIGFHLQDEEDIKKINIVEGQTDANISWDADIFSTYKIFYGVKGADKTSVETTAIEYLLEGLTPGTIYEVTISGSTDGSKYEVMHNATFETIAKTSETPMILIENYQTKSDIPINLRTINLNSSDIVRWYVNGVEVESLKIKLEEGNHTIKAEVTRSSDVKYVVVKKVLVK